MTHEELMALIERAVDGEEFNDDTLGEIVAHLQGDCSDCLPVRDFARGERLNRARGVVRIALGIMDVREDDDPAKILAASRALYEILANT